MAFHDIRFPLRLSLGALGGPERRTQIVALASGHEERNSPWALSRRRYNVGHALANLDDIHDLVSFFEARHGRLHGFRYRDPLDWKSCKPSADSQPTDQTIGIGDGAADTFALVKTYASGVAGFARPIEKPVADTVRVAVDGVELAAGSDFTVDAAAGIVTFAPGAVPDLGAVVTAGFSFDVPVRFDTDRLVIGLEAFAAGEAPDVPLVEIRL